LRLANVRAVDVATAAARIRVAAAQLQGAQVMWLPSPTLGGDYNRHDGPSQDALGNISNTGHSSAMIGLGTGMLNYGVISVNDAIFTPLAARQLLGASQAELQAASNDTLVAVSDAYFTVQQARGQLAGAIEATRRIEVLIARTRKMAPAIVAELELFRAETELARRQETELFAREQWKVASAELLRILRLDPSAQVEPVEPSQLRVELIDVRKPVDELIPIGLTSRPELASQQAQVQATLTLLRQERLRPLMPSVLLRGYSTPVTGTLGFGYFAGGTNSSISNGGLREDFDLQLLWQLNNLGFGNRALVRQRQEERELAVINLFRIQDRVAAEVSQAYAQAQMAGRRVEVAERGLRSAILSADKNLAALSETKGVGNQLVTLVRPQEVVAAIQALAQAYLDYYGAVGDVNRAQFRLFRALGRPAQSVLNGTTLSSASPTHSAAEPLPAPNPLPKNRSTKQ
jgi:outer membrane protein TolC